MGDHHHHDRRAVDVAVLTISTSRSLDGDDSGDAIVAAIEDAGHTVTARDLVGDEIGVIRERVETFADREDVDVIIATGGTGVTADDVTIEALKPLFERVLPGFGERFRARSVEEAGPHAMLTRATAGIVDDVPVFCLPGSESAAAFGTAELVTPMLGHLVGLLSEAE